MVLPGRVPELSVPLLLTPQRILSQIRTPASHVQHLGGWLLGGTYPSKESSEDSEHLPYHVTRVALSKSFPENIPCDDGREYFTEGVVMHPSYGKENSKVL